MNWECSCMQGHHHFLGSLICVCVPHKQNSQHQTQTNTTWLTPITAEKQIRAVWTQMKYSRCTVLHLAWIKHALDSGPATCCCLCDYCWSISPAVAVWCIWILPPSHFAPSEGLLWAAVFSSVYMSHTGKEKYWFFRSFQTWRAITNGSSRQTEEYICAQALNQVSWRIQKNKKKHLNYNLKLSTDLESKTSRKKTLLHRRFKSCRDIFFYMSISTVYPTLTCFSMPA